jgi:trehalose 6-phosphate phosphatase
MERDLVDPAVQEACALAAQALSARPSGLVTDLDGTISPIASAPEDAFVLPGCRRALDTLRRRLDVVAVVSGRSVDEARRLLDVDGIVYLGNHGLDSRPAGESLSRDGDPARADIQRALAELRAALAGQAGLRFEDKGTIIAIHYRAAAEPESVRSRVLDAAAESAARHGLAVGEGKKVVELRPSHWAGKGAALEDLARGHGLRGLVYLGDDYPDLHAFDALARFRRDDGLRTLSIGVGGPEAPSELADRADVMLEGPEQVEVFMADMVGILGDHQCGGAD